MNAGDLLRCPPERLSGASRRVLTLRLPHFRHAQLERAAAGEGLDKQTYVLRGLAALFADLDRRFPPEATP